MSEAILRIVRDPLLTTLDDLKDMRTAAQKELSELSDARDRLREAEEAEKQALEVIGELGRQEVAAMAEWARTGSAGAIPAIDVEKRQQLATALVEAQARAAAARTVGSDIDGAVAAARSRLDGIERDIAGVADALIAEQFKSGLADLVIAAGDFRMRLAKVYGARQALITRGQALQAKGEDPSGAWRLAESLNEVERPHLELSVNEVEAHVPTWLRRHQELTQ